MQDHVSKIFANLDRWRHLPNYQLERRTDIFFSVYLKEIVEEFEKCSLLDVIIPELPIKIEGCARSFKVDYLLFSADRKIAYFIELKTDGGSRRDEQDEYLQKAAAQGFRQILNDVREIACRTTSYGKYWHLLNLLSEVEVLKLPADLKGLVFPMPRPGLRECLSRIEVLADMQIQVIYVQPQKKADCPAERCIDFNFIVQHLKLYNDEFSQAFAKHLTKWQEQAGSEPVG